LRANGIDTPDFRLFDDSQLAYFHLDFPCIVKPAAEDASHGLTEKSVVYDMASLRQQLNEFNNTCSGQALGEEFIDGREFNITVIGDSARCTALPISQIVYSLPQGKPEMLTYAAKWQPDSIYYKNTRVVCPAEITDDEQKQMDKTAVAAFGLLGCRGYARVDMRMDNKGRLYVIEVNPNPDISPSAGAARQAQAAGLTYIQFIDRIVQLALE
ncbi:MAG: ATP-grasp domain-containing protein, partial [Dehalococcoidales bacterium]|nr:ATP-grasp domain-containing protein [Dehalococcoidales bacterium]